MDLGCVVQLQPGSYDSCLVEWYLVRASLRTSTLPFRAKMVPRNMNDFFTTEQLEKSLCRAQVYCFCVLSISSEPFVPSRFLLHPSKINREHPPKSSHTALIQNIQYPIQSSSKQSQTATCRRHVVSSLAAKPRICRFFPNGPCIPSSKTNTPMSLP